MSVKTTYWKCQSCGGTFARRQPGEPKDCPLCGDKGAKSYRGPGSKAEAAPCAAKTR